MLGPVTELSEWVMLDTGPSSCLSHVVNGYNSEFSYVSKEIGYRILCNQIIFCGKYLMCHFQQSKYFAKYTKYVIIKICNNENCVIYKINA